MNEGRVAIGVVSPGAMGAAVAAAADPTLAVMLWAGEGRGPRTHARAEAAGMVDVGTIGELADRCDTILSVCPPATAREVAESVFSAGFRGTYVEANAVAPSTARAIAEQAPEGVRVVDGGIVGPPPAREGSTRLYLAGDGSEAFAKVFAKGVLECILLDGPPGAASALKSCYAANTKAVGAMLMAIRALAAAEGVDEALVREWARSQPHALKTSESWATSSAPKAWRFVGEMHEIGDALVDRDLPDGFLRAAAEVYERLAGFKNTEDPAGIESVIEMLLGPPPA